MNLVTRINAQYHGLDNPQVKPALRATQEYIDFSIAELAKYMTFSDEVPLSSPVTGSSDFTREFAGRGPRDGQGRSLRQFDLKTRLFRYPLSYMIYSQSFDDLNPLARERVLRGVYDALRAKGGWIEVRDAVKRALPKDAPVPGAIRKNGAAAEVAVEAKEAE